LHTTLAAAAVPVKGRGFKLSRRPNCSPRPYGGHSWRAISQQWTGKPMPVRMQMVNKTGGSGSTDGFWQKQATHTIAVHLYWHTTPPALEAKYAMKT
jgi:hypothetical protein